MEGSEPEDGRFRRYIRIRRPDLAPEDVRRVFWGCYLCELALKILVGAADFSGTKSLRAFAKVPRRAG